MFEYRALIRQMEKIYKDFMVITHRLSDEEEMSAYDTLRSFASSSRIRKDFEVLVKNYLDYVADERDSVGKNLYLVISIDDLDMAHIHQDSKSALEGERSYNILNSILKYLTIPRVIVLAAYNHINLYQQCTGFFLKDEEKLREVSDMPTAEITTAGTAAREFLEKVFSPVYYLYMPSWRKADHVDERICIRIDEKYKDKLLFIKYMKKQNEMSVKDFLLYLYEGIFRIYYDPLGGKRHFIEPDSFRELSETVRFLMDSGIEYQETADSDKDEGVYKIRLKRLKDDVYFNFALHRINSEREKQLFEKWSQKKLIGGARRL